MGRSRVTRRWGGTAMMLLVACGAPVATLEAPTAPDGVAAPDLPRESPPESSDGHVRIAYPDVPAAWVQPRGDDVAAQDLAAIWGLPLFRLDEHGQLRSGLVTNFRQSWDADRFVVEVDLAPGRWSDGAAVTAEDVVATVLAVRDAGGPSLASLTGATTIDADTARLEFDQEVHAWPYALAATGGVLPAAVLAEGGVEAFTDALAVTGGWFHLEAYEPGRSATFVANESSPLGRPAVERVTVLFVPRYEAALGFLVKGEVDVVLGHLALNPVERGVALDNIEAGAPLGGTSVVLEVRPGGRLGEVGPAVRQEVTSAVEIGQLVEGLLGDGGELASSLFPGAEGPFVEQRIGVSDAPTVTMLVPRWHEAMGFTARTLERDLEAHQVATDLVSEETPFFTRTARQRYDLVLRIRRDPPLPALVSYVSEDDAGLVAGAGVGNTAAVDQFVRDAGFVRPLYRIGPAHAWRDTLQGVRPSAWPGLALWNVGNWTLEGP